MSIFSWPFWAQRTADEQQRNTAADALVSMTLVRTGRGELHQDRGTHGFEHPKEQPVGLSLEIRHTRQEENVVFETTLEGKKAWSTHSEPSQVTYDAGG